MDKQMRNLLKSETYREIIWDSTEEDLNRYKRDIRPIRWFILLWVGIVYLWGCAQLLLGGYVRLPLGGFIFIISAMSWHAPFSTSIPPPPAKASIFKTGSLPPTFRFDHAYPSLSVIGGMLMAVQFCLHWICLSGRLQRHWYWFYFLLQGGCVLMISFVWSDAIIAFGLYLVLIIEALSMLKQVRQIVVVVATYLALFVMTIVWQATQIAIWMTLESVLLLMIFIIGWTILSIQQVYAHGQLEAAHLQLAAYAMRLEELTLVNERQRLARELHDTLAQDLVGLTLQLERVDLHLEKKRFERAHELVQQAMARARTTLAEARYAIDDLRVNTLDPDDLLQAIQREIERFMETTSIVCVADIASLSLVPENLCEHVLRAITEGLTNIARHAQAHRVWISASLNEAMLIIEVRDDGTGFDSKTAVIQSGHYGLLGLRERARLVGGHLDIASSPGKGATLRLNLPMDRKEEVCID